LNLGTALIMMFSR